jgi:hypothetical protein
MHSTTQTDQFSRFIASSKNVYIQLNINISASKP